MRLNPFFAELCFLAGNRNQLIPVILRQTVLEAADGPWQASELPHLAAGLYHLIFGYFANAGLLETVLDADPRSPAAVERQRRFLKTAVARLIGAPTARKSAAPAKGKRKG